MGGPQRSLSDAEYDRLNESCDSSNSSFSCIVGECNDNNTCVGFDYDRKCNVLDVCSDRPRLLYCVGFI